MYPGSPEIRGKNVRMYYMLGAFGRKPCAPTGRKINVYVGAYGIRPNIIEINLKVE